MPKRSPRIPRQPTQTHTIELEAAAKKRGEDLRQEAARRNIGQHELAQQLNVSQATISRYLSGAILHPAHDLVERVRVWFAQRDVWPIEPTSAAPALTWEQIEHDPQPTDPFNIHAQLGELSSDQRLRLYQCDPLTCRVVPGGAPKQGQFCIVKKDGHVIRAIYWLETSDKLIPTLPAYKEFNLAEVEVVGRIDRIS